MIYRKEAMHIAVTRAVREGWDMLGCRTEDWRISGELNPHIRTYRISPGSPRISEAQEVRIHWREFIFDHGFAKGVWGVQWKYHLMRMVIAPDAVEYLLENL